MTNKTKPIFNSFQEYIEAENMVFKTLQGNMEKRKQLLKYKEHLRNL